MVKRLRLKDHLHVAELERAYRRAGDPVARSQWQILWLLTRGEATAAAVAATGYPATWIYQIVQRYNAEGAAGIGDRRHGNPGAAPLLAAAGPQRAEEARQEPGPVGDDRGHQATIGAIRRR